MFGAQRAYLARARREQFFRFIFYEYIYCIFVFIRVCCCMHTTNIMMYCIIVCLKTLLKLLFFKNKLKQFSNMKIFLVNIRNFIRTLFCFDLLVLLGARRMSCAIELHNMYIHTYIQCMLQKS